MPVSRLKLTAGVCLGKAALPVEDESPKAAGLIQRVSEAFDVSAVAARVRLIQLGCLAPRP